MIRKKYFFKYINPELKYILWLLIKKSNQIKQILDFYLPLVFFYIPLVPFDLKIKYLPLKSLPLLNNNFERIFDIDLYSYTKKYIKRLYNKKYLQKKDFEKVCWLVASFRKDEDIYEDLVRLLDKNNPEIIDNLRLRYLYLYPFSLLGDWAFMDDLLLFTREKLNKKLSRNSGFYGEDQHLTAIGHMCLFVYLLQAIDCGYLNKNFSEYTFLFNRKIVKNKLFFELIKEYALKLKINLFEADNKNLEINDCEIEVWPHQEDRTKGILARNKYYELAKKLSIQNQSFFLKVPSCHIEISKKILKKYLNEESKFFVGVHFRSSFDLKTLRNSSILNAKYICKLIKANGGQPLLIGANKILSKSLEKYALDIKDISKSRYEYEALQFFIWSNSKFFVGSQSGGTNPASLFGTVTLWLDSHPLSQARPANMFDLFIPKRVFSKKLSRYLTYQESTSNEHRFCQTENIFYANNYGYKVLPAHKDSVEKAFNYAMEMCVYKSQINNNTDLKSRIFYKAD